MPIKWSALKVAESLDELEAIVKEAEPILLKKIGMALNWSSEIEAIERKKVQLSESEKQLVKDFADRLKVQDSKQIQFTVFETARKHSLEPKDFFKLLYKILLGTESGPRLGPYLVDFGVDKARTILLSTVQEQ